MSGDRGTGDRLDAAEPVQDRVGQSLGTLRYRLKTDVYVRRTAWDAVQGEFSTIKLGDCGAEKAQGRHERGLKTLARSVPCGLHIPRAERAARAVSRGW